MFRFNTAALFCSSGTPNSDQITSGTINQISRVQSVNIELNFPSENLDYLNQNTEIISTEKPVINLTYDYLATNGNNERNIGLVTDGYNSAFYKLSQEKNYYLVSLDSNSAYDINSDTGNLVRQCFGIGNVVLNSYSVTASVGSFVTVSVAAEGYNLTYYTGTSGENNPGINLANGDQLSGTFVVPVVSEQSPQYSLNPANDVVALSYKDLMLEFPNDSVFFTYLSGSNAAILQNFTLSFSVNRENVKALGNLYGQRSIIFPIDVELSAEAYIDKYKADVLKTLDCYNTGHNVNILIKQPCSDYLALEYYLRGLRLETMSFATSVGQYTIGNFRWRGRIGGNLSLSGTNLYILANGGNESFIADTATTITGIDQFGNPLFIQEIIWRRVLNENYFSP